MYFDVFWKEWCATISSCWLVKECKTFKWPPKSKNATLECIKATLPKENWNTIQYSRFLEPFATFNEARDIEVQAVDISTNDEDAFEAITNEATNCKSLPTKRTIIKPRRLCSSSDEEYNKKQCIQNKRPLKIQASISSDENEESDESVRISKSQNVQKNVPKTSNELYFDESQK